MKPLVSDGSSNASKLFRLLVVGGISIAATAGCSSSSSTPDDKDSGKSDAAPSMDAMMDGPCLNTSTPPDCTHGMCAW
jgi:hypothetical protein